MVLHVKLLPRRIQCIIIIMYFLVVFVNCACLTTKNEMVDIRPLIRPSKKNRCFSSPPASFLAAASSFLLFTNFSANLYVALVVVQKMYIQLSNSFGHRSAERILPYENCSYSTVTWHRPKLDVWPEIWDILYARYAIEQLRFKSECYVNHFDL